MTTTSQANIFFTPTNQQLLDIAKEHPELDQKIKDSIIQKLHDGALKYIQPKLQERTNEKKINNPSLTYSKRIIFNNIMDTQLAKVNYLDISNYFTVELKKELEHIGTNVLNDEKVQEKLKKLKKLQLINQ